MYIKGINNNHLIINNIKVTFKGLIIKELIIKGGGGGERVNLTGLPWKKSPLQANVSHT